MDREVLGKAHQQPLIWPAPRTPSRTLRTVPGGTRGGFSILPTRSLLALKETLPSSELYDQEPNSIQSSSLFEVEHLAETLSQPCSNLAGEELILTISTFSFSIEYERNQVNFC